MARLFDDLFSIRNSPPCRELIYDRIPEGCRLQISYIVKDFFEVNHIAPFSDEHLWPDIQEGLKRLHQTKSLYREELHAALGGYIKASAEVLGYLEDEDNFSKTMDTIEVVFRMIEDIENLMNGSGYPFFVRPDRAISNLNSCFKTNCIGYKFEGKMLIRIDSELLYSNITKETMVFLSKPEYVNINDEYLLAHRHYRAGDYEDCIVNCNKSFELTMKVICCLKGYPFNQNDTAPALVKTLFDNHFISGILQQYVTGLRKTPAEGVSVIRNNRGGHGKGVAVIGVNDNLASYTLNITGSAVKFLLGILEEK